MLRTLSCLVAALIVVSVVHTPLAAGADAETAGVDAEAAGVDAETTSAPEVTEGGEADDSGGFLSYEEPPAHPRRSFASLILRLVLSMAVILGLIYRGLMLVKLLARKAKVAPKSEKLIRIVDRAALDQKRAVYLIKVVDRLLVVGVGTNEIRTLAQIEDETAIENVQETEFTGHLQSLLGRLAGRRN